jgi:hypothetical protein
MTPRRASRHEEFIRTPRRQMRRHRLRAASAFTAFGIWALGCQWAAAQATAPAAARGVPSVVHADESAGFREFTDRVQAYVALQKTVAARLPPLEPTDLPEMITAYQQALARRIREARPLAKPGDILTPAAAEAFRHAIRTALTGAHATEAHAFMRQDAPNPNLRLVVNGTYPDTETIMVLSPALLAAFPPLPTEVAYRFVGRTLLVVDMNSRLIVDFAPLILPPPA